MTLALFESAWDVISRAPALPTDDSGVYTLFEGGTERGWQLVAHNWATDPPTVTVLIATNAAIMAALKVDASLLWLADMGSPIHDAPMAKPGPQGVNNAVQWLKDNGYSGAEFGQAIAAIATSSARREFTGNVTGELHGTALVDIERQHIGS